MSCQAAFASDSETTTVSGSARFCSREARFGVSPTTPRSRALAFADQFATTTRPVEMPIRTQRDVVLAPKFPTASISRDAGRVARSASSSWARG